LDFIRTDARLRFQDIQHQHAPSMSTSTKILFILASLASAVLIVVAVFRPFRSAPQEAPVPEAPIDALELYMTDAMDYGVPFSQILAEKRIAEARRIAQQYPVLRARANEVADSLAARLARKAKITKDSKR
jgi:hypothetical protein